MARILEHTGGNVAEAARLLGVDRKTLYRKKGLLSQDATGVPKWDGNVTN
jgi:DNA-binding protein Fis